MTQKHEFQVWKIGAADPDYYTQQKYPSQLKKKGKLSMIKDG